LKALESGPRHCYFILCTTDLNKIIPTVKSRCTKWKVNLLDDKKIESLINWVLKQEEHKISDDVLEEIIKISEGCPREALVNLDTVFDLDPEDMLTALQQDQAMREVRELCQAMLKEASWPELAGIIKGMKDVDAERARQAIIAWFASVALDRKGFNKKNKKQWESVASKSALVFDCFRETFFYTGMSGLTFSTYNTTL